MHGKKWVWTYLPALCTFLSICNAHVLHDFLLTMVQIPSLCQKDVFSFFIFSDGIDGLAHTLSSSLIKRVYISLRFNFLQWIYNQFCRIFDKPLATHRHSVSSWCWAEGHSGYLCRCSAPFLRSPQGRTFFRQHHWHTQTWLESWAELPGLKSAWLLELKDPLARHH